MATLRQIQEDARRIYAAAEALKGQEPGLGEPEEPIEPEEPAPMKGVLIVEDAEGVPGDTVRIAVRGGTNFETNGFALGIGCDPAKLTLVVSRPSPELQELLGIDQPQPVIKQQTGGGMRDFIQMGVMFFGSVGDLLGIPGEPLPPREIKNVVIPMETPLYELDLKIAPTLKAGAQITLDIENFYFNEHAWGAKVHWDDMYTTDKAVSRTGFYPRKAARVSGSITVV